MAEYRTCTNGATLWQVKNYLYDRFQQSGGAPQTFTIQSSLFTGKTIRAFEQGRIIETNSDGIISITLAPDGHDMLLAYAARHEPAGSRPDRRRAVRGASRRRPRLLGQGAVRLRGHDEPAAEGRVQGSRATTATA